MTKANPVLIKFLLAPPLLNAQEVDILHLSTIESEAFEVMRQL